MIESDAVATQIVHTPIPTRLLQEAQMLVNDGWFANLDELLVQALRRFLESHRAELLDQFVREDVAWGLHGQE